VGSDKTEYRARRGGNAKLSRFGFTNVAHPAGPAIGGHIIARVRENNFRSGG
jgi:hypothetical protein